MTIWSTHPCPGSRRVQRSAAARAFTLVELIAVVAALGVVGSLASLTLRTALDGYVGAATQAQLHAELSIAMDRITRELHNINLKSGSSVAPDISSVTATSIAWNNNYSLSLSSGRVMFVDNGSAPGILLDDVTAFSVQTYDESNTALSASLSGSGCDPIRRIQVQITLQRDGVTESLRDKVFLRCMVEGAG